MDKAAAAPERAVIQSRKIDEVPPGWAEIQDSLAAGAGLAVLLIDGPQPPSLVVSNNNSVCHAFQTSPAHAHLCEPYCGRAFDRATGGDPALASYRCHAGLHCVARAVKLRDEERPLAVIAGRAFLRSTDYRALAERIRAGDMADLRAEDPFRNVIFASPQDLGELAERVEEEALKFARSAAEPMKILGDDRPSEPAQFGAEADAAERPAPRSSKDYFSPGVSLHEACATAVPSLVEAHGINSVALLLRDNETLVPYCITGRFIKSPPHITLSAKEVKLLHAASRGDSIKLPVSGRAASGRQSSVELFPLVVGEEVKGALVVGDAELSDLQRRAVADFCQEIALPLEVVRLREELD
ncbi:MAG: PocR ligand-binding domain-containing protein, partial [Pyrinomonadaceae bacterium]